MVVTFVHPTLAVGVAVDALVGAGFIVESEARRQRRTLLDTFDGRLHAAGVQLEHRGGELVITQDGSPAATVRIDSVPRLADDLPPGPLRARLGPLLEERALIPMVGIEADERVLRRRNRDDKAVAEVTLSSDLGPNLAGTSWAATVADLRGHDGPADDVAMVLAALGATHSALGLLEAAAVNTGVDLAGFDSSPTVPLDPDMPALDGFVTVFSRLREAIEANWQGTIEEIDTEFLHDLRVAVRRTRSVLKLGKLVVPDVVRDQFRTDFGWFGEITSRARDLDVYLMEWGGYAHELAPPVRAALAPVHDHLVEHRRAAHGRLAEAMGSHRAAGIRRRWAEWLAAPSAGEHAHHRLGDVVAKRLRAAQKRVIDDGRAITPTSPGEDLHELRKTAKQLRYLVECFGGLMPDEARKSFVKTLKGLQDNLGEHQDTEVHAAELRSVAHELSDASTDTILALGQLTERLEVRRAAARAEFAERFAAYDTKATRHLVKRLARHMRS